jgi:hypothetical protein
MPIIDKQDLPHPRAPQDDGLTSASSRVVPALVPPKGGIRHGRHSTIVKQMGIMWAMRVLSLCPRPFRERWH